MNQIYFYLLFRMGHGTVLFELTLLSILIIHAILFFIVVWMIELFNSIMRVWALFISAVLFFTEVLRILIF